MKGLVEIGYLTKFGALRSNRDQVMSLETIKIHTNVSNFVTASPKPYKFLKYSSVFHLNFKIHHASSI